MTAQPSLFDAQAKRADGLQRVEEHADPSWNDDAYTFIAEYARHHEIVFCDDLWNAGLPEPREMRALGPVFLRLSRNRVIAKTGYMRPSVRSNLTEKPVWRSLVWRSA